MFLFTQSLRALRRAYTKESWHNGYVFGLLGLVFWYFGLWPFDLLSFDMLVFEYFVFVGSISTELKAPAPGICKCHARSLYFRITRTISSPCIPFGIIFVASKRSPLGPEGAQGGPKGPFPPLGA